MKRDKAGSFLYNHCRMDDIFLSKIKEADIITIFSHHFPDGDAVGTAMGLKCVLKNAFPDKQVYCVGEDVKKWVHAFGLHDAVSDETIRNSLGIAVDHNAIRRVGDQRAATCKAFLRFDHHVEGEELYDCPAICDVDAVSASQVVLAWCIRVGLPVPKEAVTDFLTAFLDDSVQYTDANRPADYDKQLKIMLDLGGDLEAAKSKAYWRDPADAAYEKLLLARMKQEDGICWAVMHDEDYTDVGLTYPGAGSKSSFLLKNSTAHAALLFTYCGGEVRLSARSNDTYSVEALCAHYGGGGHEQAAGMIFKASEFNLDDILAEAKKRVKKHK